MQWDRSPNGGFTTASKAWLAVNPNFAQINAAQEIKDPNSVYHYFQRLIELRKQTPAFVYGDYRDLDPAQPTVFAYTRDRYLVVLNFSRNPLRYALPSGVQAGRLVLSNQAAAKEEHTGTLNLRAWEARIYRE
jgi:oligo-1,6-glucosidase